MNLHKEMISKGIRPNVVNYNTLLIGFFNVGRVGDARKLLDEMQVNDVAPDSCTFTTFIDGLCNNDCVLDALEFFHTLEENPKFQQTIEIPSCLIDGLCKSKRIEMAWELFHRLPHKGLVPNFITYNIMINGICKQGELGKANSLLLDMEAKGCFPNVITFNTLMRGFIQNNETPKVVELLHKMAKRNVIPDATTFSIVIDLLGIEENYRECLNSLPSFPIQEPTKS
ncbi:hypothetical protein Q3G72_010235 [Acer saccharum]|nr:hypothetical protein Q3G72_010235 [Acer saccharum]